MQLKKLFLIAISCQLLAFSIARPVSATIALDTFSAGTVTTNDLTMNVTPSNPPRGALVFVMGNLNNGDGINYCTYGGVTMTQVNAGQSYGSPVVKTTPLAENLEVHAFFLGSGIPTGTQPVTCNINAGYNNNKQMAVYTFWNGPAGPIVNTEIVTSATLSGDSVANPVVALDLQGRTSFVAIGAASGINAMASNVAPSSGWSSLLETDAPPLFRQGYLSYSYNTIASSNLSNVGYVPNSSDDAVLIGVAVSEVIPPPVSPTLSWVGQWQESSYGPPSCVTASSTGCYSPINTSNVAQAKQGSFGILGDLSASRIFATNQMGVGTTTLGSTLHVNGQVKIRGPVDVNYGPAINRVLTAVDDTGLARWQALAAGVANLMEGLGIDFCSLLDSNDCSPTSITNSGGWIKVKFSEAQLRIPPCASTIGALQSPSSLPPCRDFVTTITAPASGGLLGPTSPTSGPITLSVNVGPGLRINSANNQVELNVATSTSGDGLTINGTQLEFEENCGDGQTWKYNTGAVPARWECSGLPIATSTQPGGSVMYLKSVNSGTPLACPSPWTEVVASSTLPYTSNESVGRASDVTYNKVRVCYRPDVSCQVIRLKLRSSSSSLFPACPATWSSTASSTEYALGGVNTDYAKNCYICY